MIKIFNKIIELQKIGESSILATIIKKEGSGPAVIGSKMLFYSDGHLGTVGGGSVEFIIIKNAMELLKEGKSLVQKYSLSESNELIEDIKDTGMICGGKITVFFDFLSAFSKVYIFGAGHVGKALVYYLKNNWNITLVDNREDIDVSLFNDIDVVIKNYEEFIKNKNFTFDSYYLIATPSHKWDYVVLENLLKKKIYPKYIGIVASKKKSEKFKEKLKTDFPDLKENIIYTPVGLKIGGKSVDEIAISIASEIQAIKYNITGNIENFRDYEKSK